MGGGERRGVGRARPPGLPTLADQWAALRYLVRWLLLAAPVGICTGTVAAAFLWALDEATQARFDHGWLLWLLPLFGLATAAAYRWYGQQVEAGNNLVIDAIHEPGAGVPARIVPLIFAGTVIAHLGGASVGREGTAVQFGGGIASAFCDWLRPGPAERRVLLMAGVAAGFGAVFGTPLAGAVFALEVLTIGRFESALLVPTLAAALIADYTTGAWGIEHTHYAVSTVARDGTLPFDLEVMAKAVLAGVAFGLVALLFVELSHAVRALAMRLIAEPLLRPVVGGLLTIALVAALGTRDYLGLGVVSPEPGGVSIVSSFAPGGAEPFSWWWKLVFTVVAVGFAFKGGEVTPLFFIGATLGNQLAELFAAPVDLFAGMGFVAVFAAAANAPLACTLMGVELFGAGSAVYLAVAAFTAYLVSGHTGLYSAQRRGEGKWLHTRAEPQG